MDHSVKLHPEGKFKGLPIYEESLLALKPGSRTSLVAHVVMVDFDGPGGHLCKSLLYSQFFRLKYDITADTKKVTILNGLVHHYRSPILQIDNEAAVLSHPERHASDILKLVETCGGLGALGQGASYAGWSTVVLNELQQTFCDHMKKHQTVPIVQGNIKDKRTIMDIHNVDPTAGSMAWGFSCQPFSQLGDKRQGMDERSMTLPFGLVAAFLLQKEVVVLECVPNASTSVFVQLCISQFIMHTQFEKSEILLELGDLWPSKSRRWWSVLSKGYFGKVQLQELPKLTESPTIGNILPHFLRVNDQEKEQLSLTQHELQKFAQFGKGLQHQTIQMHAQLGTALHSWGNQLQECACKCRKGFSDARLMEHGLHGALVETEDPNHPYRHISPKEMAILCGFPKFTGWDDSQRLLMAGIGQLASPIQAAWIFAHIRNHFHDLRMCGLPFTKPRQIVACVCADLFRLRDEWFPEKQPPASVMMFQETIEELMEPSRITVDDMMKAKQGSSSTKGFKDPPVVEDSQTSSNKTEEIVQETDHEEQIDIGSHCQDAELLLVVKAAESTPPVEKIPKAHIQKSVDEATGGLMAFSSKKSRTSEPTKTVVEQIQVDSAPEHPKKEEEVEEHKSIQQESYPEQPKIVGRLETKKVLIWYQKDNRYDEVMCEEKTTIAELIQAEKNIQKTEFLEAFSAVGQPYTNDMMLKELPIVVLMEGTPVTSHNLSQHAFDLRAWNRADASLMQQGAVAIDEMNFYLHTLQKNIQTPCEVVDAVWFQSLADTTAIANEWIGKFSTTGMTISAILYGEHWIPIIACASSAQHFAVFTTPEGKHLWPLMFPMEDQIGKVETGIGLQSLFTWDCGFQALTWIAFSLQNQVYQPMSAIAAAEWRMLFWQYSRAQVDSSVPLILGGHQSELEVALQAILKEHGVFPDRLVDRTKQMIDTIGTSSLLGALRSNRPWAAIKQLANQCNPKMRLIQEDEFQKIVQSRTSQNKAIGTKKNQKGDRNTPSHKYLLPADVMVPTGVFTQQNGQAVPHLNIEQVSPNVKGIVVATESEYQPYASQKQISQEGLAFLVLAPYSEELAALGEEIRFPAQSVATSEPVLLSAVMIQKGQQSVQRCLPKNQVQVAQIPTQTVKFLVYRDQFPQQWQELVDRPVKQILELIPEMRVCKNTECRCKAWRPDQHQGEEPILDVWQRDFLNIHFKKCKPSDSAIFTCMMRLTTECFEMVTKQSGTDGLYCEARSNDGKRQDEEFHTVWLSKHTLEEAKVAKATSTVSASLIRVSNRYGLRVGKADAKTTHDAFRPDTPFLAGSAKSTWVVGPVPWGTTRKGLIKLFESWQWQAKPLQPAGKSADGSGLKWHVQASEAPENFVYTLSHGDVLIVKDNPEVVRQVPMHRVEASEHTMKRSLGQQPLHRDPWQEAAQQLQSSSSNKPQQISTAQIATIETNLEAKLMQKIKTQDVDANMEPSMEPRVAKLEQQLQQLQVQQMDTAKTTQQLSNKVDQFATQMDGHSRQIQGHLDQKLAEQMDRIEALLAKRQRQE